MTLYLIMADDWNEDVEFAKVAELAERYEDMSKVNGYCSQ